MTPTIFNWLEKSRYQIFTFKINVKSCCQRVKTIRFYTVTKLIIREKSERISFVHFMIHECIQYHLKYILFGLSIKFCHLHNCILKRAIINTVWSRKFSDKSLYVFLGLSGIFKNYLLFWYFRTMLTYVDLLFMMNSERRTFKHNWTRTLKRQRTERKKWTNICISDGQGHI